MQKLYTEAWDKVKATGYFMPGDAVPIKQCINTTKVQSKVSRGSLFHTVRICTGIGVGIEK